MSTHREGQPCQGSRQALGSQGQVHLFPGKGGARAPGKRHGIMKRNRFQKQTALQICLGDLGGDLTSLIPAPQNGGNAILCGAVGRVDVKKGGKHGPLGHAYDR